MNWQKDLKVKLDEPLKGKTSFKIGGSSKYYCEPKDIKELKSLVLLAKKNKVPFFVLGAGSNLLIADKALKALVIRLNAPSFKKISFNRSRVYVGSGLMLGLLVRNAAKKSLEGVEFLAGIPGTVGGALAMNAGAWGKDIGALVEEVQVMDHNGKIKALGKNKINFSYRNSDLQKFIILGARLMLFKGQKKEISKKIKKYLENKSNSQDNSYPNAGCVFRNPDGDSAGRLIDLCGLKGKRIGGACVSQKHANFILNKDGACAKDVLRLMALIRKKVSDRFNVNLKPELKIWK